MNTLFPWLSTYFESLIPGSFALGFNAGRETPPLSVGWPIRYPTR
ncbi:hypothetical protein CSPX01_02049 [Colletotrichum filicis]|nr:hypothetical protein CSPX01_02049 [Colletotrichum filicis]